MIDLRSDTTTKPTPAMREYMASAEVGDDVYGEDPTVNALEEKMAAAFGKEAALFVPSGTMANAIALNVHTSPGDSVIIEERSHCFAFEAGSASALSGIQFESIPLSENFSSQAIESVYRAPDLHHADSTLLVIENTHNFAGGVFRSADEVSVITSHAKRLGLQIHCDGARIWNAAIASKDQLSNLVEGIDSISACFSKGLGAPMGSILVGNRTFIDKARKVRKRLGGGMRQVGIVAAAADFAFENHLKDLEKDHVHAKSFAETLRTIDGVEVNYSDRSTNIVFFRESKVDAQELVSFLKERSMALIPVGDGWYRAVFHRGITDEMASASCELIVDAFSAVRD